MQYKINFYKAPTSKLKMRINEIQFNTAREVNERAIMRILERGERNPLFVKQIGTAYYLVDGFNRLMALKRLGVEIAEVIVLDCDLRPYDTAVVNGDCEKGILMNGDNLKYVMAKWLETNPGGHVTVEAA